MRKAAVSKELSLCGNEEIRFRIKGRGVKSEELRNLERAEVEYVGEEDRV